MLLGPEMGKGAWRPLKRPDSQYEPTAPVSTGCLSVSVCMAVSYASDTVQEQVGQAHMAPF